MKILAIETSCDDTCVAILEVKGGKTPRFLNAKYYRERNDRFQISSNIVSSQVKLHAKYGGVYPSLAKREHLKNLPIVFNKALKKAGFGSVFNSVAVTIGPGLEPCLWVGVNFAVELAKKMNLPIIPVNHIEAHILANFINLNTKKLFPAVCLVVSGGHTQLILMKDFGKYKILGETRDDAAGECFDKTARILGLGYPGGPAIAAAAAKLKIKNFLIRSTTRSEATGSKFKISLPRPMIYQKNYDFSFSGLKTAVLYLVKQLTEKGKKLATNQKREISAEIQQAVVDVLIHKTLKAAKDYKVKSIILGGGVAANRELRQQFQLAINNQQLAINFLVPPKNFCTDNAAMVAVAAALRIQNSKIKNQNCKPKSKSLRADSNLRLS